MAVPGGSALASTLDLCAEATSALREPWWIIGSAAAFLVGLENEVADVDLLTSPADAHDLLGAWGVEAATPSPSPLFASAVFGRASVAPLPIEVMAGTRVRGELLSPRTRIAVPWRERLLHVPDAREQIAILRLFGREKDLQRAERLEAIL
jgi:hypothetical protein